MGILRMHEALVLIIQFITRSFDKAFNIMLRNKWASQNILSKCVYCINRSFWRISR